MIRFVLEIEEDDEEPLDTSDVDKILSNMEEILGKADLSIYDTEWEYF